MKSWIHTRVKRRHPILSLVWKLLMSLQISRSFFRNRLSVLWINNKVMLVHHFFKTYHGRLYMRKCWRELNKIFVDALSSLFTKESERKVPSSQEWDDMFLKHVHLWGEGSIWEVAPEESDKCLYVLFCWQGKKSFANVWEKEKENNKILNSGRETRLLQREIF